MIRRADKSGKRHGAKAVSAWSSIAGDEIAQHTRGFAMREDRELVVFVDSAAWANQLTLMSGDLLDAINARLGENTVRALRFTVSRKVEEAIVWEVGSADTDEFYTPDDISPEPLDATEQEQVAHVAAAIKNPELREVVLRVMTKDLELKKGKRMKAAERAVEEPRSGLPGVSL
ncbi:MAG: DUF721 domain-containing protein [Coriobacteriia bacterium]|nr:DUF721 domain-containing protein [Coriobacteriia bacterium]